MARTDVPSLKSAKIGPDGRLESLEQVAADAGSVEAVSDAAIAITAHLLELLVIFIGEPLTLKLVHEAWPEISLDQ